MNSETKKDFSQLGLSQDIVDTVVKLGYENPTQFNSMLFHISYRVEMCLVKHKRVQVKQQHLHCL